MMILKFSRNDKVTFALTDRRPVRTAADDNFETGGYRPQLLSKVQKTCTEMTKFLFLSKTKLK